MQVSPRPPQWSPLPVSVTAVTQVLAVENGAVVAISKGVGGGTILLRTSNTAPAPPPLQTREGASTSLPLEFSEISVTPVGVLGGDAAADTRAFAIDGRFAVVATPRCIYHVHCDATLASCSLAGGIPSAQCATGASARYHT
jgi:hypothetical protein